MIRPGSLRELGILVFALGALSLAPARGQSRVTGTVVDASSGAPLAGANVFIDDHLRGTATDDQGRFTIADLPPGRYSVVASMVGYENKSRTIVLKHAAQADKKAASVRFKLKPDPIKMKGVTVKDSREEWLERLDRFRESFFGTAPNSDQCSFVNPEVLSFEKKGNALIAHAAKPLRVRNKALGYELRFHLPRYKMSPGYRARYGPVEFDTLEAKSPEQRKAWAEARRETYKGSYDHFIDALVADALKEEGFQYWITEDTEWRVGEGTPDPESDKMTDAAQILDPASLSGHVILAVPEPEDNLKVRYLREGESWTYVHRFRSYRSTQNNQVSLLLLRDGKRLLLNKKEGGASNGQIIQRGYWGWYETAATVLPYNYRPPEEL